VLVASTIAIFLTGVLLLAAGHKSSTLLELHKLSFIGFGVLVVAHFVAYVPRVAGSMREDWREARRVAVPGSSLRATLVALAPGGGIALSISLLHAIHAWRP
jgi:hypothetical protein